MFAVQRWCFTTCALFMLCPRRLHIDGYRSDLAKLRYPQITEPLHPLSKISPARWATNIIRDKTTSTSRLEEAEPGYDFSEDEMKKLKIWPGGIVSYYIDEFSFDKVFRDRIRTFLAVTNSITGLNFLELYRPPEDEKTRWVFFVNRQGLLNCADHPYKNFTNEGVQKVVLGYDCLTTGGELAEVVLALVGVPPQHNAPDRDRYVQIEYQNIMPGKAYLFQNIKNDEWLFHGMEYDFSSASHYPLHKYTVNGMATIRPNGAILFTPGEGKGFSFNDIWKIRMLYNYISKKRLKSINLPECKKLFNVGTNVNRFEPNSEEDVEPRNKPNKYLGLPEDSPASSNETEVVTTNSNEETYKKEITEDKNIEKEEDTANFNDESINSKEEPDNANLEKTKKNNRLSYIKDPQKPVNLIFDLSDFQTDNEYEKVNKNNNKLRFTKPGG